MSDTIIVKSFKAYICPTIGSLSVRNNPRANTTTVYPQSHFDLSIRHIIKSPAVWHQNSDHHGSRFYGWESTNAIWGGINGQIDVFPCACKVNNNKKKESSYSRLRLQQLSGESSSGGVLFLRHASLPLPGMVPSLTHNSPHLRTKSLNTAYATSATNASTPITMRISNTLGSNMSAHTIHTRHQEHGGRVGGMQRAGGATAGATVKEVLLVSNKYAKYIALCG